MAFVRAAGFMFIPRCGLDAAASCVRFIPSRDGLSWELIAAAARCWMAALRAADPLVLRLINSRLRMSDVAPSLTYEHGLILPFPAIFRNPK